MQSRDRPAQWQAVVNKHALMAKAHYEVRLGHTIAAAATFAGFGPRPVRMLRPAPLPCPAGRYSLATNLAHPDQCTPTDPGSFAATGSSEQRQCESSGDWLVRPEHPAQN